MSRAIVLEKKNYVKSIKLSRSFKSKVIQKSGMVQVTQKLPFRIKITNIGVPGYSASNPAPIGIAIIGFNNYIL
jgi:hypothetical protein